MNLSNNAILIIAGLFLWQVIGLSIGKLLFVSNAIHANLFITPNLAGGFYTLLPCILVYLFADMYKNKNS